MKLNNSYKYIHMIGIGGISMSGIADILLNWGYKISGSNNVASDLTEKLKKDGIEIHIGHNANNITNQDLVVYTAAISADNSELLRAKELHIPTMERAEFLGELTKLYSKTIAVSGTHGKTTTTSMISLCFIEGNLDPSIQVGALLKQINGNYRLGKSDYFVIEACEYVDSFLKFFPQTEIILNVEADHLDYFSGLDQIKDSFTKFISILPKDGILVINSDDENCNDVLSRVSSDIKVLTYGIKNTSANVVATDISFDENGFASFKIIFNNIEYPGFKLNVPGIHNVSNACACIATCFAHNIPVEKIISGLSKFTGAARRFEYKGKTKNNVTIIDDYAHHPTEIKVVLDAARKKPLGKIWAIFQPHTYSRTKSLLNDFAHAFNDADYVIITDIYAAREIDDGTVSANDIVTLINTESPGKAIHISEFDVIADHINIHSHPNDTVFTIGAGNITDLSKHILKYS